MRKLFFLLPIVASAACTTDWPQGGTAMALVNSAGQSIGSVRAWQTAGGVTFRIDGTRLAHGIHGLHVHSVGRCTPPDFASAGGHWNPTGRKHGINNPAGPHAGDLSNVDVAANGVLAATVTLPGATMASLLDSDGAALVLHAGPDDYVTDPSGHSGGRIACAVIGGGAELR
ncbi:MAG: superoxide dismutase family protein [Sphingomicrobium sp.]